MTHLGGMQVDIRVVGFGILLFGLMFATYFVFVFEWQVGSGKTQYDVVFELYKFALVTMTVGGATILYNWIRVQQDEEKEQSEKALEQEKARLQMERDKASAKQQEVMAAEIARRRYEAERLENFFGGLTRTYNAIKTVRRTLRHYSHDLGQDSFQIQAMHYGNGMLALNSHQLELEFGKRLAKIKPAGLDNIPDQAIDSIRDAEKYLRDIVREFEQLKIEHPEEILTFSFSSAVGRFMIGKRDPRSDGDVHTNFFEKVEVFYKEIVKRMDALGQPVEKLGSLDGLEPPSSGAQGQTAGQTHI